MALSRHSRLTLDARAVHLGRGEEEQEDEWPYPPPVAIGVLRCQFCGAAAFACRAHTSCGDLGTRSEHVVEPPEVRHRLGLGIELLPRRDLLEDLPEHVARIAHVGPELLVDT